MVHEFLCIGDRRVDKPDREHQKEEYQENEFPAPLFFQFDPRVITAIQVISKEQYKWHECELHREAGKATVPGENGKEKKRCGKRGRERVLFQAFFERRVECQL